MNWRFWRRRRRVPSGPPAKQVFGTIRISRLPVEQNVGTYIVPPPMPEWVAEQIAQAIRDDLDRPVWGDGPTPLENLERVAQEWREDWAQRDWLDATAILSELMRKQRDDS